MVFFFESKKLCGNYLTKQLVGTSMNQDIQNVPLH